MNTLEIMKKAHNVLKRDPEYPNFALY